MLKSTTYVTRLGVVYTLDSGLYEERGFDGPGGFPRWLSPLLSLYHVDHLTWDLDLNYGQ